MKILLQNQYDGLLGGVETYLKLLTEALIAKGHQVIVVYTKSGKKTGERKSGYQSFYLPNLDLDEYVYYSKTRKKEIGAELSYLESIVKQEKPDVIHLNNTHYPRQYGFLKRYAPVVQTVHDFFNCCNTILKMLPDKLCSSPLGIDCFKNRCVAPLDIMELWRFKTKCLNRLAMRGFSKILVTTQFMKEMLVYNGFQENRVVVAPLFVEDWGMTIGESEPPVILYAGRLAREKGVTDFIQMLRLIPGDFKAFIIGDGPQKEECVDLVKLMGLEEKVVFTGFLNRQEIKDYFARASVVVVPSLWPEPFCLVGLEAMSCSKPVVAYDVGGISSWLNDTYNGYLVNRGDIRELARAVDFLLNRKDLARGMGKNGRRLFEEDFSKQRHLETIFAVYNEVAAARKQSHSFFLGLAGARQPGQRLGHAGRRQLRIEYPKLLPHESLPEYNKRMIEFEIQNNICVVKSYPEEITISTTTRCNMNPPCVICERNLRGKNDFEYDIDAVIMEKIKPIFKYADRIYLHCGGEPLITDKIYDVIENVAPPTKIIFNTNGALFTEKKIKYMVDRGVVEVISFSVDAATEKTYNRIRSADFNKVINNIKFLVEYRNLVNKDKPLLRPLVLMNFCIFKQNISEVPDYVLLAKKLGVDGLDFSHLNQGFDWKQVRKDYVFDYKTESVMHMENIEDHDKLILKAYALGKEHNLPINFNGSPFLDTNNSEKIKVKNEISEVVKCHKKCIAPWNRAVIETDGRVRICYFHNSSYGTIGKIKGINAAPYHAEAESFDAVWNGSQAVEVRREFLKKGIARRCVTENPCIFQNRL